MNELKRRLINRKTDSLEKIEKRFKRAYEEINERMLQIIEEVGELARAIKELGKK